MKFQKLKHIIVEHAMMLEENAGHSGSYSDGGKNSLLVKLRDYKDSLVLKLDLRPSEFDKLYEYEVGEPQIFSREINDYKLKLAKEMANNIKL